MTRGVGWLRCSGILLDAGPLVEDWDVQDVANRIGAAAAAWLCGHFDVVLHGSLAFLAPIRLRVVRMGENGSNCKSASR